MVSRQKIAIFLVLFSTFYISSSIGNIINFPLSNIPNIQFPENFIIYNPPPVAPTNVQGNTQPSPGNSNRGNEGPSGGDQRGDIRLPPLFSTNTRKQPELYFTTDGKLCTHVNEKDLPVEIQSPEYCSTLQLIRARIPSEFYELCETYEEAKRISKSRSTYHAVKYLQGKWINLSKKVFYHEPESYIMNDPYDGCVPLKSLPSCFQKEHTLPTELPLPNECNQIRPLRILNDMKRFCDNLEQHKTKWDRNGPDMTLILDIQKLWKEYKDKLRGQLREPVPYFFESS